MLYRYLLIALVCFLVVNTQPAVAGFDVSVGSGYLANETQYQIGGHVVRADGSTDSYHFPISELRFPLDSYVIKGQVDADFAEKWEVMFSAETNLTDDTGKMEDSDWGYWDRSQPNRLDIYSKSDAEMDMFVLEGKVKYRFFRGYYGQNSMNPNAGNRNIIFAYTVGLGYKYQDYDFEIFDLDQWYPSSPSTPHTYESGRVLTYDTEYQIPYLELGMKMDVGDKFLMGLDIAYAPFVSFKDEDHHLLRDKVNIADHGWSGNAMMVSLNMRYQLTKRWFLNADFEAMQIKSEGESKAYFSGVWDHTIDHEISSHQYRSYLMVGCSF